MTQTMESTQLELFVLRAALEAIISGDTVVSDDGQLITWDEPDCGLPYDRLIGIERTEEGGWRPVVEVAANA